MLFYFIYTLIFVAVLGCTLMKQNLVERSTCHYLSIAIYYLRLLIYKDM
jgi:hypothetical protein